MCQMARRGLVPLLLLAVVALLASTAAGARNLLQAAPPSSQGVLSLNWTVNVQTEAPDGFERTVLTVNGLWPPPDIHVNQGDRLIVNVTNAMNVSTAIHWHGIKHMTTPDMDGVPAVTQHLITPGGYYVYNFTLDLPGSRWWHAHFSVQYTDGLRGALITHEPKPLHPTKDDLVLKLADWYHVNASVLLYKDFLIPASEGAEPVPQYALVNSVGQRGCRPQGTKGDVPACNYTRLVATAGGTCTKPYTKLRIINTAAFATFIVTIDDHVMELIAVDSIDIEPVVVEHIQINTAQRYDVLVYRKDGQPTSGQTWIRATMDNRYFDSPSNNTDVKAVLQFGTKQSTYLPTTLPVKGGPILTDRFGIGIDPYGLVSIAPAEEHPYPVPTPTRTEYLDIIFTNEPTFAFKDYPGVALPPTLLDVTLGTFNGTPWELVDNATVPTLLEKSRSNTTFPPTAPTINLRVGDVVRIVMNNYDDGQHPIHLHGHSFYVLGRGPANSGPYTPGKSKALNTKNPLVRDTATVNGQSYLVIQFTADHAGVWFMHCHIEWHMAAGLVMSWNVVP